MKHCEKSNCVTKEIWHTYIMVKLIFILFSFSLIAHAGPLDSELQKYLSKRWKLSETQQDYLDKGKILTNADVTSSTGIQNFDMQATAMHKKRCRKVIRKLSQFELYPEWISFIKQLKYNDETKLMTMHADHPLLPFPMIVHIIMERPKKTGRYRFRFPTGIFRGLAGYFEIQEFNGRCHLYAESHWAGKQTNIPDLVIEVFSETLARIGGEILMRKSQ